MNRRHSCLARRMVTAPALGQREVKGRTFRTDEFALNPACEQARSEGDREPRKQRQYIAFPRQAATLPPDDNQQGGRKRRRYRFT